MSLTNILTHNEHRELDRKATEKNKILPLSLMEEAASYIFFDLKKRFNLNREKIAIVCGSGNNGGDGLALVRKMLSYSINIDIYIFENGRSSELYNYQKNILETLNIEFKPFGLLSNNLNQYSIIVDSIFGVGFNPARIDSETASLFNIINSSNKMVISIDTPSGFGDTSLSRDIFLNDMSLNNIISSSITYSIGFYKDSFFNVALRNRAGKIKNLKLSFFIENIDRESNFFYINKIKKIKRKDRDYVNKYSRGGVVAIGGSTGMIGSIVMSASAALRVGAGISLILTEEQNIVPISTIKRELIADKIENYKNHIKKYGTVCIGPGLKIDDSNIKIVKEIILEKKQFIIDASFFSIFDKSILSNFTTPPILTPHSGEFINFFGDEAKYIKNDTLKTVTNIAKKYNSYIILKDSFLVIATPEGVGYVYDRPNSLLAQAGSGDILSGIISGMIALNSDLSVLENIFQAVELFYSTAKFLKNNNYKTYNADYFLELLSRK